MECAVVQQPVPQWDVISQMGQTLLAAEHPEESHIGAFEDVVPIHAYKWLMKSSLHYLRVIPTLNHLIQLGAIMLGSETTSCCTQHCNGWCRTSIKVCTHWRYPIACPHGQALGSLLSRFGRKFAVIALLDDYVVLTDIYTFSTHSGSSQMIFYVLQSNAHWWQCLHNLFCCTPATYLFRWRTCKM